MSLTRSRPLLGTFVTISRSSSLAEPSDQISSVVTAAITAAFAEGERLQSVFSAHDPASELGRLNSHASVWGSADVSWELASLIARAEHLENTSLGAFTAHRINEANRVHGGGYDLSGIAKGAIVDAMTLCLERYDPSFSGVINAGGDLRLIGDVEPKVTVRCGSFEAPLLREVLLVAPHRAFATSSCAVAALDERSSTRYFLPLAPGIESTHTVCVAASECWIADALTKVGLFARAEVAERVVREYEASMVIFDAQGAVIAMRGERLAEAASSGLTDEIKAKVEV